MDYHTLLQLGRSPSAANKKPLPMRQRFENKRRIKRFALEFTLLEWFCAIR